MQKALSCYSSQFYLIGKNSRKVIYPQTPTSLAPNHRQVDGKSLLYINLPFLCSKERRKVRKKLKTKTNYSLTERTTQVFIDIYSFQKAILQKDNFMKQQHLRFCLPKATNRKYFTCFVSICMYRPCCLAWGCSSDKMVSQITHHPILQKPWKLQALHIHLPTNHSDKICSSPCLLQSEATVQDHLHCYSIQDSSNISMQMFPCKIVTINSIMAPYPLVILTSVHEEIK